MPGRAARQVSFELTIGVLGDLAADPGELNDLSSEFPDLAGELATAWQAYATSNGVVQPDGTTFYSKPVDGIKY